MNSALFFKALITMVLADVVGLIARTEAKWIVSFHLMGQLFLNVLKLVMMPLTELEAREIAVPDLRAVFAYVMAAMLVKGTSTITGLKFLV